MRLTQTAWYGEGFPVEVEGRHVGAIVSPEIGPAATITTRIAAAVMSQMLTADERGMMRAARSTSTALSQLVLCAQSNLAVVSTRALEVGFHVHGWHVAIRVDVDQPGTEDPAEAVEEDLRRLIVQRPQTRGSWWTISRPDSSLLLVRTTRSTSVRETDRSVQPAVEAMLSEVLARHPDARFRAGIATPHEGAQGLRASAEEARIALASVHVSAEAIGIATFDALGIRRILAEWLASETAYDTVSDLLAPIDALGPEKAAIAI